MALLTAADRCWKAAAGGLNAAVDVDGGAPGYAQGDAAAAPPTDVNSCGHPIG